MPLLLMRSAQSWEEVGSFGSPGALALSLVSGCGIRGDTYISS